MWGGRGVVLVLVVVVVVVGGGGGGMILGEVKARPKDIISFSLDYISKSEVQTSNPSSSPISLDTPARPADLLVMRKETLLVACPNSFARDTEDFLRMTQEISFLAVETS